MSDQKIRQEITAALVKLRSAPSGSTARTALNQVMQRHGHSEVRRVAKTMTHLTALAEVIGTKKGR